MKQKSITTSKYILESHLLNDDLMYYQHHHHYEFPLNESDVFGNYWVLGFAELEPGQLYFSDGSRNLELKGAFGILIPPFSIVQWRVRSKKLIWHAFIWKQHLFTELPRLNKPVAFSLLKKHWPTSLESLNAVLNCQLSKLDFNENEKINTSQKIKTLIDESLGESLSIKQISQTLGLSPSVITRSFKKFFGVTPVCYRNKLRVFESMIHLLFEKEKTNIAQLGFQVGFSDLSRYNKEFKKFILTSPKDFQLKKHR